ncbi:hypothetical protein [Pasteuria penetrans]|nr:hypothetical protein [Pasteuria penetrans]
MAVVGVVVSSSICGVVTPEIWRQVVGRFLVFSLLDNRRVVAFMQSAVA